MSLKNDDECSSTTPLCASPLCTMEHFDVSHPFVCLPTRLQGHYPPPPPTHTHTSPHPLTTHSSSTPPPHFPATHTPDVKMHLLCRVPPPGTPSTPAHPTYPSPPAPTPIPNSVPAPAPQLYTPALLSAASNLTRGPQQPTCLLACLHNPPPPAPGTTLRSSCWCAPSPSHTHTPAWPRAASKYTKSMKY